MPPVSFNFQPRDSGMKDIQVHILYWSVCHTDLYSSLPGQEIIGRVAKVGEHVIVFTTWPNKVKDALRVGADDVATSKNDWMANIDSVHHILDSVAAQLDINPKLVFLKRDGSLIYGHRGFSGYLTGAIKETQATRAVHGRHHAASDITTIPIRIINEAYGSPVSNNGKYRFLIDRALLKTAM